MRIFGQRFMAKYVHLSPSPSPTPPARQNKKRGRTTTRFLVGEASVQGRRRARRPAGPFSERYRFGTKRSVEGDAAPASRPDRSLAADEAAPEAEAEVPHLAAWIFSGWQCALILPKISSGRSVSVASVDHELSLLARALNVAILQNRTAPAAPRLVKQAGSAVCDQCFGGDREARAQSGRRVSQR